MEATASASPHVGRRRDYMTVPQIDDRWVRARSAPETELTERRPLHWRGQFQYRLRTLLLVFLLLASSLAVFGIWGIAVFTFVVGLAIYFHRVKSLPENAPLLAIFLVCLIGLLPTAVQWTSRIGYDPCLANMQHLAMALQCYHQANGCLPPAYIADKSGKPMHSWRALILPIPGLRPALQDLRLCRTLGRPAQQEAVVHASQGVCLPERLQRPSGRHFRNKLRCRCGSECGLETR